MFCQGERETQRDTERERDRQTDTQRQRDRERRERGRESELKDQFGFRPDLEPLMSHLSSGCQSTERTITNVWL